jgi:hypothetical protein
MARGFEKRGTSYRQVFDGEWVRPKRRGYKVACCDCGLIHVINYRIKDGHIEYQPTRDNRATAARRRGLMRKAA